MGRPAEAFVHAERGFALYDRDRHASQAFLYGNHDPGVCCRYHLALTGWLLGYADRSLNASHEALCLAEELKHPYTMANALWFTAVVHYERGDQETAATNAGRALALAREHGFTQWVDVGLVLSHLRTKERSDAQMLAELHRRLVSWTGGATWRQVFCLCVVAELYAESGLVEDALGTLASIPGEHRGAFYAPELHRIEGELLLQRSPPATDEAERRFCAAVDLARGRAEKSLELRAATSLARLWQRQGQRDDARRLLGDVYGWFTEGFDTADLRDAKTLLDDLSSTSV
jgi:predicted ATPase